MPLVSSSFRRWGYGPLAPVIEVDLEINGKIVARSVCAIVDPGADITCVNLKKCNLQQYGAMRLDNRGHRFLAALLVNGKKVVPPRGMWNLANDFFGEEVVVIGRDLLNQWQVTLDGCQDPPRVTIVECNETL